MQRSMIFLLPSYNPDYKDYKGSFVLCPGMQEKRKKADTMPGIDKPEYRRSRLCHSCRTVCHNLKRKGIFDCLFSGKYPACSYRTEITELKPWAKIT